MKNPFRLLLTILFSLLFWSATAQEKEAVLSQYQKDSLAVEEYLDSMSYYLTRPEILQKTDTLFQLAGKVKNYRRQALALSYKLDYYYNRKEKDSLFVAIDRVQEFSKKYNQPIYYYFSWQRKITYYINSNQFNLALHELNAMQEDAIAAGAYSAQIDTYGMRGRIYFARRLYEEAGDSFSKAIELFENAPEGVEVPTIYGIYLASARINQQLGRIEEMKSAIDKALLNARTTSTKCAVYLALSDYYLIVDDLPKAEMYLKMTEDLQYYRLSMEGKRTTVHTKLQIAKYKKDFEQQRIWTDSLFILKRTQTNKYSEKANYYGDVGDYYNQAQYLIKEMRFRDSCNIADIRNELSEMMILMDVNKIKAESDKAEIEMKNRLLIVTIILSLFLFVALLVAILMMLRYYKTNKKLSMSENNLCKVVIQLEEESRAKSDFLRNLSHEVRTPLNSIVGFSNLIAEHYSKNASSAGYAKRINEGAQQLNKLISDAVKMTTYSDEGVKTFSDVNSLFRSALDYLEIKMNTGVVLKFKPCEDENHRAVMDTEKITVILSNLLHNASKFTKSGEVVLSVKIDLKSEKLIYTVTDTGCGIPESKQKEIFAYFTKVDSMTQGLGLGLPLSRHLAESMGGTLTIDPNYTNGCRMVLSIPYVTQKNLTA